MSLALIVSYALVDVESEVEALELAAKVEKRARVDVGAVLARARVDAADAGLLGFGASVVMLQAEG